MNQHHTTRRFWRLYGELSAAVQARADRQFERLKSDPKHPSLHFKRVGRFWSARVDSDFRVLGVDHPDGILWFWIGPHEEYDRLIV